MPDQHARPLRADARLNQDRLLEAAARAFARDGAGASLKAIAADAGVGIGTLYRRFPTREHLVEATYRREVARLCAAVPRLLTEHPPRVALRRWMIGFADLMATKHGMADALRALLADDDRMRTRAVLTEALAALLEAGVAEGSVNRATDPYDVLLSLGGVAFVAAESVRVERTHRIVDLLLDGVAPAGGAPISTPDGGAGYTATGPAGHATTPNVTFW
ncbi:MAG TPA: TetR/AcrR family transcriptional regulator [Pseudonocardia sp.]